ncbi:MAG: sodium:proton antiporter [Bacteroidales bacterium]|jgi:Na+/H+ antiporter NhaD/arsenite permease-like protein|nr:sodium:proton antiporter [Bacteroidales bacterium]
MLESSHELVDLPLWSLIPFVLMLLMIAIAPLFMNHWWEKNKNKLIVSLVLGIPTAIYLIAVGLTHNLTHQLLFDYVPFIVLLGALFTVTGGIYLKGDIAAKPLVNTLFLGIGGILASFMGTTGAAMLLIRPVINTNQQRKHKVHTILFLIAIVANCGGLLTPLGDPPLFLLYLRGVEFTWFFNLLPAWALANGLLLLIYFVWDSYLYKKEPAEHILKDKAETVPLKIIGTSNFIWLAGIIAAVAFITSKTFFTAQEDIEHYSNTFKLIQAGVLIIMAVLSLLFTKKVIRESNKFSWAPITEVAFLFLGIFVTMVPALLYLSANAKSFGLNEPWHFYYATGVLSSFLDNAPTAISFYELATGTFENVVDGVAGIPAVIMKCISLGAVFFGAMTYIGNGPNFMVKAIAEENKISMPSFFGYIIKFSLIVLLPVYIIIMIVFI